MVHLDYRDARPIYAQIIDGIREQILAGILLPGEKLPSVRELAGTLAINPNTIQRAYRSLELDGWIATVPGKGCFVCSTVKNEKRDQERLLCELDDLTARLYALGMTEEELILHLKGGKQNA